MFIQKQLRNLVIPGMDSFKRVESFISHKSLGDFLIVPKVKGFILTPLMYFGSIIILILVSLVLIALLSINEGKKQQLSNAIHFISTKSPIVISSMQASNLNREFQSVEYKTVFSILVLQSNDKSLIGQRFDFCKGIAYIGGSSTYDFFSPKDFETIKGHAVITFCDGKYCLMDGKLRGDLPDQPNTYAEVIVNDLPVADETLIINGDLIKIGETLLLRFEC